MKINGVGLGNTRKALWIPALIIMVIASGCLGPSATNCGSSESCFTGSLESCSPAYIKTAEKSITLSNLTVLYSINATILGREGDACMVEETISEMEIRGNMTDAPARLLFLLVSLYNSRMRCPADPGIGIDLEGSRAMLANCSGTLRDMLDEIFRMEESPGTASATYLKVEDYFCVGRERIVIYIRNVGDSPVNLTKDFRLFDKTSGTEVKNPDWKDFTGSLAISELLIGQIGQLKISSSPGIHTFEYSAGDYKGEIVVEC